MRFPLKIQRCHRVEFCSNRNVDAYICLVNHFPVQPSQLTTKTLFYTDTVSPPSPPFSRLVRNASIHRFYLSRFLLIKVIIYRYWAHERAHRYKSYGPFSSFSPLPPFRCDCAHNFSIHTRTVWFPIYLHPRRCSTNAVFKSRKILITTVDEKKHLVLVFCY